MIAYPPPMVENPKAKDAMGEIIEGEPLEIEDPTARYDMNEIFALINCTTSNLRELADDIGTFNNRITSAKEKETRGFSVGNLIMNLESQKQKLSLEFDGYIERLGKFLEQNKSFSGRCLKRIELISGEIVTAEEQAEQEESTDEVEILKKELQKQNKAKRERDNYNPGEKRFKPIASTSGNGVAQGPKVEKIKSPQKLKISPH